MKIFLVRGGSLAEDLTDAFSGITAFEEGDMLVCAPDRARVGWGFDPAARGPAARGDARFLKPIPPPGWLYDGESGTLYRMADCPADCPADRPESGTETDRKTTEGG